MTGEANAILAAAGKSDSPPMLPPSAELLKPLIPILRQSDQAWPRLTVSKSFFEGGLFQTDNANTISAAIALDDDAMADAGGDWGDMEDLDVPELNGAAEKRNADAAISGAPTAKTNGDGAPVEGEGWDLDAELDIPLDEVSMPSGSAAGAAVVFNPPTHGTSVTDIWIRNSSLAADHVAAGSFETAMQVGVLAS